MSRRNGTGRSKHCEAVPYRSLDLLTLKELVNQTQKRERNGLSAVPLAFVSLSRQSRNLPRVIHSTGFPDNGDLDLTRVFECFLDLLDDILGKPGCAEIID